MTTRDRYSTQHANITPEPNPSRREFIRSVGAISAAGATGGLSPSQSSEPAIVRPSNTKSAHLRRLIEGPRPVMCPGVYDVLTARMVESLGFPAAVMGGSACSASIHGLPDYGLVSITELTALAGRLASAIDIPLVADADDAGGSPLNVFRAVRDLAQAGVAVCMVEDHVQTKHVGEPGTLVAPELMEDKIRAAVEAQSERDIVVIARADSVSVGESVSQAIARGRGYAKAGADILFFAGMKLDDCPRAANETGRPLMTTVRDTPLETLAEQRISLAVYASHALQLALGAAYRGLKELRETGAVSDFGNRVVPSEQYSRWIGAQPWRERAKRYL